jgi:fibronectin type 3 domain-containing protein
MSGTPEGGGEARYMKGLSLKALLPSFAICILIVTLALSNAVHAGNNAVPPARSTVTLTWDQPPDRTVKGYRVHYGVTSGRNYLHVLNAGKTTSCKVSDLVPGKKYYFVVTSYNASGKESLASNEATFTAPRLTATPHP